MYNKRTWLNTEKSDSTGSVVAFDGKVTDLDTNKEYPQRYLEIADCRTKVRLHKTSDDTDEDFLNKMKLLKSEIEQFVEHLTYGSMPKCKSPNGNMCPHCEIWPCDYLKQVKSTE